VRILISWTNSGGSEERIEYIKLRAKKVTASPWEMIYYYENEEEGIHLTITLTPHQPFTKDHHITLQSIKREAITMLKVVILAMCFEGDITFVISELKVKSIVKGI